MWLPPPPLLQHQWRERDRQMSVRCMYKTFTVLEALEIIISNYALNLYRIKVIELKVVGLNVI
jgi:hypothetical protein